jgi:hypothetical protein
MGTRLSGIAYTDTSSTPGGRLRKWLGVDEAAVVRELPAQRAEVTGRGLHVDRNVVGVPDEVVG